MAKFCTYCGKPLPDNGVCDCPESVAARPAPQPAAPQYAPQPAAPQYAPQPAAPQYAPQPAPAQQPVSENAYVKKTKEAVSQSVPFVKDYWKDTMAATRHVLQDKNMGLAVVMMVVNALVTGLILFFTLSKLSTALQLEKPEVPFISSLLLGMVMAAVALALSAIVVFVVLKALKINAGFDHVVMAVGVNSIPCTVCLLLALLMVLAGWVTGVLLFLLLGMITWVVMGALVLVRVFNAPVSSMMQLCCCVLFTAVLVVNVWAGSKLAVNAAGKVEFGSKNNRMEVSDIFDEFEEVMEKLEEVDDLSDLMRIF